MLLLGNTNEALDGLAAVIPSFAKLIVFCYRSSRLFAVMYCLVR